MSIRCSTFCSSTLSIVVATWVALVLAGCQKAPEAPVEAPPERVENASLGVAIADLPDAFTVRTNAGEVLELVPADTAMEGVVSVRASEATDRGINLVAAVEQHKADIEARPDGAFKGQRELGTPMGTAFYSRGHFSEGGRTMEETAIFMIHPAGDRELHLVYLYPAGDDTATRLQDQLFELLGEVEGVASAAGAPAAGDPAADASPAG